MDADYRNEPFVTFKIKASVGKKFRRYCKGISKSQSMTLLLMIEFFESNGLSPNESIGPHIYTLENLIKKRINAIIAIVKDIEKTQTKPTAAMLLSLIEKAEPEKEPLVLENNNFRKDVQRSPEAEKDNRFNS